ncbi:tRNA (adenosine(37)-N6)-dimethylallyltransferase MiaA [Scytonema millei]|uniref:tRNA dimethylallyltransferase n=1 Tax=Scytonema millei VB511283 TaxID=1245923 RepID=A0A9X5E185_9CYAN|nr:tRNA (adenosine(37)-N6)-dimethylallyltransferase MiaA [Scytonema millei]NHC33384.1 tRNA (adenosine(37)-N6)-dimethylallyltransferase MiaA [Scytonema millei VB511283]
MYQTDISHGFGLITICGATATGKSGLAITIAQRLNSVIISADSRQVYREFNLGTAKPTAAQQQLVPHYLIDICDPTETFTVAEYQEQARELIENSEFGIWNSELNAPSASLASSAPPALLVGGTGLYIRSIVRGMKIPRVASQPELRSQLLSLGQKQLYAMLQQVDPLAATKIHPNDPTRTVRALEVFYVTGRPISTQQGEDPPLYPILQIGLDCESNALTQRISQRTEQMVADGLVAEVESLCQKYRMDLHLLNTLGYQEFKQYLAGDLSLEEAKKLTVLHTRQFAKRQRTWFRAYPQIEWFDADSSDLVERVWQRIQNFMAQLNLKENEKL